MAEIKVSAEREYSVRIAGDWRGDLSPIASKRDRVAIIYPATLTDSLPTFSYSNSEVLLLPIPDGEAGKSSKTINYIWRQNADETSVRSMIKLGNELYERISTVANHADKLGRSIMSTVKDYNTFASSLESRVLVTARKLNDLDENALGTEEIITPREIEAGPQSLTASELTIESEIDETKN